MEAHRCNGAIVVAGTEENALAIEIKGPLFDLGETIDEEREMDVEVARIHLERAFGFVLDQDATVTFDFEEE